ncbi:MAG TPA: hypothetical protein VGD07_14570 [Methylomirabilota bacterium]
MLDARGRFLRAALGFVTLPAAPRHPALDALHRYLDSWRGVGVVAAGMARQDFDLQLTRYAERGWRANSRTAGVQHRAGGRCSRGIGTRRKATSAW